MIFSIMNLLWSSGCNAWHEDEGSSLYWIPISVLAWSFYIDVWRCGGLSLVLQQLKTPLKIFIMSRDYYLFRVFISLQYDRSSWKLSKTNFSFLFFLWVIPYFVIGYTTWGPMLTCIERSIFGDNWQKYHRSRRHLSRMSSDMYGFKWYTP